MANPPEWLQDLTDRVAEAIEAVDVLAPLGCHYAETSEGWEITLFAASTEIIGGDQDGRRRPSRFFLDLDRVKSVFESVESYMWQAQGLGAMDDVGPHIAILGRYAGHPVWLRIPSVAPRQFPPGRRANVHQQNWEEVW